MVAGLVLIAAPLYWLQREPRRPTPEPVQTLSRYLKAAYARDFKQAYRFISAKDKKLKPEKIYSREQGAFTGFALEVARKLADFITVRPTQLQLEDDRAQVKVALKLPDASSLSKLLLEWDDDGQNAALHTKREKLPENVEKLKSGGKMKMIEGEEEIVLVKEGETLKL